MDLWKFYDLIDAPTAISFLQEMGLSDKVAKPLQNFYERLWRIMSLNGAAADGLFVGCRRRRRTRPDEPCITSPRDPKRDPEGVPEGLEFSVVVICLG